MEWIFSTKEFLILVSSSQTQCFRVRPRLQQSFPCSRHLYAGVYMGDIHPWFQHELYLSRHELYLSQHELDLSQHELDLSQHDELYLSQHELYFNIN